MELQRLPVDQHRNEFISALQNYKFVCVIGSTGCGKLHASQHFVTRITYSSGPAHGRSPSGSGMAKALLASRDCYCIEEMLTIAAIMSTQQPCIIRPKKRERSRPIHGSDGEGLITGTISKASANQKARRAGRTQDEVCYRLYSELAFANQMLDHTPPEVKRKRPIRW
ncbi:hypothetical protein niasHT_008329 [Heterodera trifolii]|uniref:Uncharacterized protein n=1 Tax=Heterodera trifolii TaxID=157864 RepID=A0ABD2M2M7_9BILA